MQKKIIALAVAGLMSGAAFAQSNVTVYGTADGTFDVVKVSGTGSTEPRHNRVTSNSSFLGFKGAEDLGGGLKAVFQFEGGVNTSSGAAFSFDRDTMVGLAGGFGTVVFGNLTGPTRALGAGSDVFAGATGVGANSGIIGKFGGMLTNVTVDANGAPGYTAPARSGTQASTFDTRWKNTVAYISPNFSGFTAIAAYVANENKTDAAAGFNTYGYDLGLMYANGPVTAGATYNKAYINNVAAIATLMAPASGLLDISAGDFRMAASYDFGVAKVIGLYDRVKVNATGFGEHQTTWGLGVQVPVSGAGKIVGQYYKAGDISGTALDNYGAKLWAVGYEHSLSKRTILKATYSHLNADTNGLYGFGVSGNAVTAGDTSTGWQFGLRHSF